MLVEVGEASAMVLAVLSELSNRMSWRRVMSLMITPPVESGRAMLTEPSSPFGDTCVIGPSGRTGGSC